MGGWEGGEGEGREREGRRGEVEGTRGGQARGEREMGADFRCDGLGLGLL